MRLEDTIAAVATAPGEAAIGVIKISGPRALEIADAVFRARSGVRLVNCPGFTVHYGVVWDAERGEAVDEALATVMRAPRSYTREDVVELSCHGGPVPVSRVLQLVLSQGARLAEPGEFTRRAFLRGRIDLIQAEATLDLVRARTEESGRAAMEQLGGQLSAEIRQLRRALIEVLAEVEARLDFPDEVGPLQVDQLRERVAGVRRVAEELLATAKAGRILREGMRVAIVGRPNVGKSSLLNALVREARAIVTEVPGTTRDVIEEWINVRGIPVALADTAGLRDTQDPVEAEGVRRALCAVDRADLVVLVLDDSAGIQPEDVRIAKWLAGRQSIAVVNKIDLGCDQITGEAVQDLLPGARVVRVSALRGWGIQDLETTIAQLAWDGVVVSRHKPLVTNIRHQEALRQAVEHLSRADAGLAEGIPAELISIDLREAWECLGEMVGESVSEDVLDEIFRQFCVGK
mgnify:CR=1 FL=1